VARRQPSFTNALSYFLPIFAPDITHSHPGYTPSDIRLASLYLGHMGLPADLVPKVLDLAEYWSECKRECKRETRVIAGAAPPRLTRGYGGRWLNGQEDELGDGQQGGLKDGLGETWYLVSEKVGCVESFDPVLDKLEGLSNVEEVQDGDEGGVKGKEKAKETSSRGENENKVEEEAGEAGQSKESKRKGWLRRIVIKTLSKDQGWSSSNPECYGRWPAGVDPDLTSRHVRPKLHLV
jgi:hypothetical protein